MTGDIKHPRHLTLALETSCDETSAAVVLNGRTILSNVISSQVPLYQKYGGVVPEIASRKHIENVIPVVDQALLQADVNLTDINLIGVTYGPGLAGALLVGIAAAKALSFARNIPLVGVNHLEGHIFANFLVYKELKPPFVSLIASGGHTLLAHVKDYNDFILLGETRDDAAGEAFDKIARVLGLPYPGGPHIEKAAKDGDKDAIVFPRALTGKNQNEFFDFSFSGLKSAALNYLNQARQQNKSLNVADMAASFQAAIVDVLKHKTILAAKTAGVNKITICGGVAANLSLCREIYKNALAENMELYYPPPVLCTDNAAMIACRAYYQTLDSENNKSNLNLNAVPGLKLKSVENIL
jgi:N6-L-threonylcarbamoyladenine synthase